MNKFSHNKSKYNIYIILFLKSEIMNEFYNNVIKKYSKNINLTSDDIIAVGDVHGSYLQVFYPLISSGLINNVKFEKTKIKFDITKNYKTCPTVIFLGDYFHKSVCEKSFLLVHSLLKIKNVVKDKLILLLGNHDINQYVYEKNIITKSTIEFPDNVFIKACEIEHINAKQKHIKEFILAVETNIFQISYVDKFGNIYSHTVLNSNQPCISNTQRSEAGFHPSDFPIISEFEQSKSNNLNKSNEQEKQHSQLSQSITNQDIISYNSTLRDVLQTNFNRCIELDYKMLINHINYLNDRPLTNIPIDPDMISKSIILFSKTNKDISHSLSKHIVGHTPSFKRHPENNHDILIILNKFIDFLDNFNYSLNKNFINWNKFHKIISELHAKNTYSTTKHGNIICCDSQSIFSINEIAWILYVEKGYEIYIKQLMHLFFMYEQPSYYIITQENKFKLVFGELEILDM